MRARTTSLAVRTGLVTAALLCAGSGLAGSAAGKTFTIGPQNPAAEAWLHGCDISGCFWTLFQFAQPTPSVNLTAPADGTIVSWQVHGRTSGGGRLRLRVIRPTPDGLYRGAGASAPAIASQGDGSPPRSVSIPIRRGDYIGVDTTSPTGSDEAFVYESAPGLPSTIEWFGSGLAEGAAGAQRTAWITGGSRWARWSSTHCRRSGPSPPRRDRRRGARPS
jgi:hypothetical protein